MKKFFLSLTVFLFGFGGIVTPIFMAPSDAMANRNALIQDEDRPDAARDATTDADVRGAILDVVNYFLTFLGLLAVLMLIYAGVLMVASSGDEEAVGKAKKIILYAGAGIILVILSYAIVNLFVGALLN